MPPRSSAKRKTRPGKHTPTFASMLANRLDPVKVNVFKALDYAPTERQQEFHDATEYDLLFGGAAGGGKSKAILMEGLRVCIEYPGIRVGAFRRTFPELEESLLAELAQVGYAKALGARYVRLTHDLLFDNGSKLMFRYARNLPDATVRQGGQYQLLLFDEYTLFPPGVTAFLASRLRAGNGIPVLGVRAGSNPGGAGHGLAKKKYIDSTDKGAKVHVDERNRTVRFIQSKATDNKHINPEYITDLQGLPEAMRKAFLDGSWDSFSGQVFTEWSTDTHVVPRFELPLSWKRFQGIDYGWAAPWVVLWGARDEDGRVWVYREITDTKVIEKNQARRILAAEAAGETIALRAADPAMWARTGEALSVADQYAEIGVHLTPAENNRITGKQRTHSYLALGPACRYHREECGWSVCPMLHVLQGAAPELVRTIAALASDPKRPEDVDTNGEDHHYDALRYLLVMIGAGPSFPLLNGGNLTMSLAERAGVVAGVPFDNTGYVIAPPPEAAELADPRTAPALTTRGGGVMRLPTAS